MPRRCAGTLLMRRMRLYAEWALGQLKHLFPRNMTLTEAREAIKDAPGFRETKKGDVILFNYDFAFKGSFPDPASEADPKKAYILKVRRECRGLIFSESTPIDAHARCTDCNAALQAQGR